MLNLIEIRGFRCFPDLKAPLRALTVLVGPNDSGKSAFLAAIDHFANRRGWENTDYWRCDSTVGRVHIKGTTRNRVMTVQPDGSASSPTGTILDLTGQCSIYQLPARGLAMLSTGHADSEGPPTISANGENLPALFDYFLRQDRKRFFACVDTLRELVPGLQDIQIATPHPNQRRVDVVIENGLQIPAAKASAGVRLLMFFVAMAHHSNPPQVIMIEEPENGVHPKRLGDVMRLLREITQGKHGGHAAQVILTTHSPHLLDHVDLKTDQVLVFNRDDDGSRTAKPADEKRLKNFLDEFMLGEVWFNEGEDGLVEKPS